MKKQTQRIPPPKPTHVFQPSPGIPNQILSIYPFQQWQTSNILSHLMEKAPK